MSLLDGDLLMPRVFWEKGVLAFPTNVIMKTKSHVPQKLNSNEEHYKSLKYMQCRMCVSRLELM